MSACEKAVRTEQKWQKRCPPVGGFVQFYPATRRLVRLSSGIRIKVVTAPACPLHDELTNINRSAPIADRPPPDARKRRFWAR